MYFSYRCILYNLALKIQSSPIGSSFTQSRSLNGYLLLTDDTKINRLSFDMK